MPVQAEAELEAYLVPPGEIEGTLDWEVLYPQRGPIEVEVGCGKGRFLAERALSHPDRNLLGLELGLPWLRRAAHRLRKAGAGNVRLVRSDARHVLRHLLADACVRTLHVYFPDPWPKRRHHKRRLFDPVTTAAIERVLEAGGELHVATDHADYFEVIVLSIARNTRLRRLEGRRTIGGTASNFGVKYLAEQRPIHEAVWVKP